MDTECWSILCIIHTNVSYTPVFFQFHTSLASDCRTMFFCTKNPSSVSTPSSNSCFRTQSCSRFHMPISTTLLGEQRVGVDEVGGGEGESAFANAVAALVRALSLR